MEVFLSCCGRSGLCLEEPVTNPAAKSSPLAKLPIKRGTCEIRTIWSDAATDRPLRQPVHKKKFLDQPQSHAWAPKTISFSRDHFRRGSTCQRRQASQKAGLAWLLCRWRPSQRTALSCLLLYSSQSSFLFSHLTHTYPPKPVKELLQSNPLLMSLSLLR